MNKLKKINLNLEQRSALTGNLFVLPFYLGFIFFFLIPIFKSFYYMFCKVSFDVGSINTDFIGLENFNYIFNKDLDFKQNLIVSVTELLWKTPVCLVMSLLLALLANRKSIATPFLRSVFFLPVIFTSGVVLSTIQKDSVASLMMSGTVISSTGQLENHSTFTALLTETGLNSKIVDLFSNISSNVFKVLYDCGIPMLIFLSALQGIAPSLYEASSVEGATAWDNFWKITLPMITPTILICIVYIVIDSFSSASQAVMKQIMAMIELLRLGEASAMVWVFCLIIGVIFGIFFAIFNKLKVFESH